MDDVKKRPAFGTIRTDSDVVFGLFLRRHLRSFQAAGRWLLLLPHQDQNRPEAPGKQHLGTTQTREIETKTVVFVCLFVLGPHLEPFKGGEEGGGGWGASAVHEHGETLLFGRGPVEDGGGRGDGKEERGRLS